jgi:thiol:disulfide interchange protein DsbD
MLDFYADWCISCKEMERFTFVDPRVQQALSNVVLLQADVTANNADDKALLKRFDLFGPPGILFFGKDGKELPVRVIGFQSADKFVESLARAGFTPGA